MSTGEQLLSLLSPLLVLSLLSLLLSLCGLCTLSCSRSRFGSCSRSYSRSCSHSCSRHIVRARKLTIRVHAFTHVNLLFLHVHVTLRTVGGSCSTSLVFNQTPYVGAPESSDELRMVRHLV
jgi:hypothetical protein